MPEARRDRFYQRATGNEIAKDDPFTLHVDKNKHLKGLYLDAEHEDGYQRDQSVFGDGISIEDTMGVMVRYKNKAILTYSLNAICHGKASMCKSMALRAVLR